MTIASDGFAISSVSRRTAVDNLCKLRFAFLTRNKINVRKNAALQNTTNKSHKFISKREGRRLGDHTCTRWGCWNKGPRRFNGIWVEKFEGQSQNIAILYLTVNWTRNISFCGRNVVELVRSVSQSIGLSILHGKLLRNVSQLPLTVEKSAKLDFERLMKDETRVHATKNPSEILRSRARISDWYPCPLLNLLRFDDQKKYISVDQIESCHWGTKVSDTENWIPQSRFQSDKYKK